MVTTVGSYTDERNRASAGEGYDGVVRISCGGLYGTGVLLHDGRAVLTVAHLFSGSTTATVHFETASGSRQTAGEAVLVHPDYDGGNNNDLALVWLASPAPTDAERHGLYRDADERGQVFTLVGYGMPGTGASGAIDGQTGTPVRLLAENRFDAYGEKLKAVLGASMAWSPSAGTQLVADFDDGSAAHDALGELIYRPNTGLGAREGLISSGDSGGPAFIDGRLAGIASYTASLTRGSIHPDIDTQANSSYGELGFWQRVSAYQQWIDQSLRAEYADAPTTPAEVKKSVAEGDAGTSIVYFLLQFGGVRADPEQWLSVDYATRDGTAQAGADYLATSGTLILYPDENQAAIPVEVLGDAYAEADETFYLDVTNPVGGSFGVGVAKLTAMRTIIDDDGTAWV